ncbi:MAG: hypothetical protein II194_05635 [Bacteroidales bacterium]|nr:hypothetical protein [Bacteroidales bacterium]
MNGIESYIKENIYRVDAFPVPEGSRSVFLVKVMAERRRRGLRRFAVAISSMAATVAIALCLVLSSPSDDIEKYHRRLAAKEAEILTVISETFPENLEEVMNTIRAVTSEAVPLEEQLPEDMEEKSKKLILKEYYDIRYKALDTILEQYTATY